MLRIAIRPALVLALLLGAAAVRATEPPPLADAPADSGTAGGTPNADDRERELARMRAERGLRVCRKSADGALQYSGTTEGYERRQVQVLISKIVSTATGEPVPGFRETRVWDDPANWSICS